MKTEPDETDGWTEAHSATIPRVDLVAKAANGSPGFLLMKSAVGSMVDPDVVRELIAKAQPTNADLMAAIHASSSKETKMAKADPTPEVVPDAPLPTADEIPTDAPGDPDDPASPAWEAVDACPLSKSSSIWG